MSSLSAQTCKVCANTTYISRHARNRISTRYLTRHKIGSEEQEIKIRFSPQLLTYRTISNTASTFYLTEKYGRVNDDNNKESISDGDSNPNSINNNQRSISQSLNLCIENVKRYDFDSYLHGLLLPKDQQLGFFALKSFNVETALVRDSTRSNVVTGQMRLRWWKAVISDLYESHSMKKSNPLKKKISPVEERESSESLNISEPLFEALNNSNRQLKENNPTIHLLSVAITKYKLTRIFLDRIIDARMVDLECIQPTSFSQVEDYVENTACSLLYLLCEVAGIRNSQVTHAAMHVGKGIGISTLLRGTHHHLGNNQLYLPTELLRTHKITTGEVMKRTNIEGLKAVIYEMATEAYLHLEQARIMTTSTRKLRMSASNNSNDRSPTDSMNMNKNDVVVDGHDHKQISEKYKTPANKIFLASIRSSIFLEDLQTAEFDVFHPTIRPGSHMKYQVRLLWSYLRGNF